jgi:hypothetical protein
MQVLLPLSFLLFINRHKQVQVVTFELGSMRMVCWSKFKVTHCSSVVDCTVTARKDWLQPLNVASQGHPTDVLKSRKAEHDDDSTTCFMLLLNVMRYERSECSFTSQICVMLTYSLCPQRDSFNLVGSNQTAATYYIILK